MKLKTHFSVIGSMLAFALHSQGQWTQKANFGGGNRFDATEFSIGNKGYFCAGGSNSSFFKDLWEYDPLMDTWTQRASMPVGVRSDPVAFVVDTCAYVGMGYGTASLFYSDFWKWNQTTNTWSQIANYPGNNGVGLAAGVAFSIGGKGYVGTGGGWATSSLSCSDDFWEYDPSTDTWTQKTTFPGGPRWFAVGFVIGNKGYIGTGVNATSSIDTYYKDFWEYDPSTDAWAQKADIGDSLRAYAFGFSIGNNGYVGSGRESSNYHDFWEWNPITDTWTIKANYPGSGVYTCSGFSLGTKGYMGIGGAPSTNAQSDFWEFDPSIVGVPESTNQIAVNVFPNPTSSILTLEFGTSGEKKVVIHDSFGKEILSISIDEATLQISVQDFAEGQYFYSVTSKDGEVRSGRFVVSR